MGGEGGGTGQQTANQTGPSYLIMVFTASENHTSG